MYINAYTYNVYTGQNGSQASRYIYICIYIYMYIHTYTRIHIMYIQGRMGRKRIPTPIARGRGGGSACSGAQHV